MLIRVFLNHTGAYFYVMHERLHNNFKSVKLTQCSFFKKSEAYFSHLLQKLKYLCNKAARYRRDTFKSFLGKNGPHFKVAEFAKKINNIYPTEINALFREAVPEVSSTQLLDDSRPYRLVGTYFLDFVSFFSNFFLIFYYSKNSHFQCTITINYLQYPTWNKLMNVRM